MIIQNFTKILEENLKIGFYTGVPDSLLKALCDYLINTYDVSDKHMIAANEGNAVALASGYHLATNKTACVYLQNSGIGNIVNPVASLTSGDVYGIGCVYVIGWRGEPNVHDEPQHVFQGKKTLELIEALDIEYTIIDEKYSEDDLKEVAIRYSELINSGKSVAFVIKKGGLTYDEKVSYSNDNKVKREEIIEKIIEKYGDDIFVSTTGKTSRELFEIREKLNQSHSKDFLTVGSMGHSSSIALGIALNKPNKRVWCIDGDGAVLMHMGSMAVAGTQNVSNLVHVLINNASHESVGGQPTVSDKIDFVNIAKACGYAYAKCAESLDELEKILCEIKNINQTVFIEVRSAIGSRKDLGRPTSTPAQNKIAFMKELEIQ